GCNIMVNHILWELWASARHGDVTSRQDGPRQRRPYGGGGAATPPGFCETAAHADACPSAHVQIRPAGAGRRVPFPARRGRGPVPAPGVRPVAGPAEPVPEW